MPFGPNAINPGYGQSQNNPTGLSNEVIASNPAQTPGNFVITGGSIDGTPIGLTTPAAAHFTTVQINTPLTVANGGTGVSSTPSNGQLLIGNGSGFSLNTLTAGAGMLITNSSGTITLQTTGGSGTVTSVDVSGGTTGLTFSGGPVTSSGTITLAGTLAIESGGTSATTAASARSNLGVTATGADTTYAFRANNLSDLASAATARTNLGLGGLATLNTVNLATTATGGVSSILPIANGGTSASTATAARTALSAAVLGANNDITSMSGITGNIATINQATFATSPTGTSVGAGKVFWDSTYGAMSIGMDANVAGLTNQTNFFYIKASSAITIGQVVMFTGSVGASGVLTGAPATGVTDGSYIMGIAAESIALNGFGYVQAFGPLKGFDTSSFSAGAVLWYDPAVTGGLTATKPSAPNVKVQVAVVINSGSGSSGSVFIRVHPGSVLGGTDSNVQFGTLTDNNFIAYSSSASRWENLTPAAARTALGVSSTGSDTTYAFRANNLSDLASAATARTNLGLGTLAVQSDSSVSITGGSITGTSISGSTGSFTGLTVNGNAVTVNGAATLNNWFDQSVKTTASPTFASLSTGSGAISGGAISGTTGGFSGQLSLGTNGSAQGYIKLWSAGGASREGNIYSPAGGGLQIDTNSNAYPIRLDGSGVTITSPLTAAAGSFTTLSIGASSFPIQETNFGYSNTYKVLRIGTNAAQRSVALCVDPLAVTGSSFTGSGQILIGNSSILAPNGAGTDWMGVLRATGGNVNIGPNLASGEVSGPLTVSSTGAAVTGTGSFSGSVAFNATNGFYCNSATGTYTRWQYNGSNRGIIGTSNQVLAGSSDDFVVGTENAGRLLFSTNNVARMEIAAAGGVSVTGTLGASGNVWSGNDAFPISSGTTDGAYLASVGTFVASRSGSEVLNLRRRTSDGDMAKFSRDTTQVGSIYVTTTSTAYNTSSDARLKTNIRDLTKSGAIIDALKPRIFDWKSGASPDTYGFVAQETYAVFPQAVTKGDDDPETITQQWGVDAAKLVPVLVAEIKSLRARVAALES